MLEDLSKEYPNWGIRNVNKEIGPILMARDVGAANGAKNFTFFKSIEAMKSFIFSRSRIQQRGTSPNVFGLLNKES